MHVDNVIKVTLKFITRLLLLTTSSHVKFSVTRTEQYLFINKARGYFQILGVHERPDLNCLYEIFLRNSNHTKNLFEHVLRKVSKNGIPEFNFNLVDIFI